MEPCKNADCPIVSLYEVFLYQWYTIKIDIRPQAASFKSRGWLLYTVQFQL